MVTLRATLLSELNRVLGPQQFRCIHIQGPALSDLNLSPIPATPPSIPSLHRLPNNLNLGIEGVPGQELYGALAGKIATSPASACRSGQTGGSHVLQAMGIPSERAHATLRLGLHPRLSRDDMITAAEILGQAIRQSSRF
jgi:cysteine sulfinate desulfinase/cysteine desulfurase-like protein